MARKAVPWFLLTVLSVIGCYYLFDLPILSLVLHLPRPVLDVFEIITRFGESHLYLLASGVSFLFFRYVVANRVWADRSLFIFSSIALSGILVNIIKILFGRMRPLLFTEAGLYGFEFFRIGYEYASFPSGHTATAFSLAVALWLICPWPSFRVLLLIFAFLVGISRVVIGVHFAGDFLAGAYLGSATAFLLKGYFCRRRCKTGDIPDSDRSL